jgi:multicomponent K+:H+ antiporter subunit E
MRTFALVLTLWLVLNESIAPAQVVLGSLVALGAALAFARLRPERRAARNPLAIVRLIMSVAADVARSNVAVAAIVLGLGRRGRVAGFLEMPVEVSTPEALAAMACIVTATPGTSWVRYDAASRSVMIHVLDLVDEEAWIRQFKQRYEKRLQEIFE